jgi:hypothetical protein
VELQQKQLHVLGKEQPKEQRKSYSKLYHSIIPTKNSSSMFRNSFQALPATMAAKT